MITVCCVIGIIGTGVVGGEGGVVWVRVGVGVDDHGGGLFCFE